MGLFSWVGDVLNDITGVNSSAKKQKNNQLELQHDAQNFAKWQMNNAHQAEVNDLQKAGLNPVLSAGGSGASAGVTEGSASVGTGMDPATMITSIIGAMNSAKQTETMSKKADAEIENIEADTQNKNITNTYLPQVTQSMIELNNAQSAKTRQEKQNLVAQETFQMLKNEILSNEKEINYSGNKVENKKEIINKIINNQKKILEIQANKIGINSKEWKQSWDVALGMINDFVKSWSPFIDSLKGGNEYNFNTNSPTVNY